MGLRFPWWVFSWAGDGTAFGQCPQTYSKNHSEQHSDKETPLGTAKRPLPSQLSSVVGTHLIYGCSFFAYSWKLPAYNGAFLLTIDNLAFLLTIGASLLTALAFYLQLELFYLPQESASNQGLKGL